MQNTAERPFLSAVNNIPQNYFQKSNIPFNYIREQNVCYYNFHMSASMFRPHVDCIVKIMMHPNMVNLPWLIALLHMNLCKYMTAFVQGFRCLDTFKFPVFSMILKSTRSQLQHHRNFHIKVPTVYRRLLFHLSWTVYLPTTLWLMNSCLEETSVSYPETLPAILKKFAWAFQLKAAMSPEFIRKHYKTLVSSTLVGLQESMVCFPEGRYCVLMTLCGLGIGLQISRIWRLLLKLNVS